MERELVHLSPGDIEPHPIIKEMEDEGIFSYTPGELERLIESVQRDGFLQPILVMKGEDGKYLRIAGKMRVEAARSLGCTVPCYIREFSDDTQVVNAAKAENFNRRLWDPVRMTKEERAIEKFLSQRSQKRIKNVRKLSPRMQEFVKQGVLKIRADEALIEDLKVLSFDAQDKIANIIEEIKNAVITKYSEKPDAKVEIEKAIRAGVEARVGKIAAEFRETEEKYQEEISKLRERLEQTNVVISQHKSNSVDVDKVVESWQKRVKALQTELSEKEHEINRLREEIYNQYSTANRDNEEIASRGTRVLLNATSIATNNIKSIIETYIKDLPEMLEPDFITKDTVLVFHDYWLKLWKQIDKHYGPTIARMVHEKIVSIEAKAEQTREMEAKDNGASVTADSQ